MKYTAHELEMIQNLPLDIKIRMTEDEIAKEQAKIQEERDRLKKYIAMLISFKGFKEGKR